MKITRLNDLIEDGKKVEGHWKLGRNGELQYRSLKKDEEFKFKAPLVAAEPDALVVSVTERQSDQRAVTHLAKLTGSWRADAQNRLVFSAQRESGKKDELTFTGLWEVNKNQEIAYRVRRTSLKTKTKTGQELVLSGFWDLGEKNRLVYRLSGGDGPSLRFRGAFQTKSILAKKGEIRYQLGAEASRTARTRTLTLFGRWVVSKDLGLSFELENPGKDMRALQFKGDFHLNGNDEISVALKTKRGEALGVELILTRSFFGKDGEAFLRLRRSVEETGLEAGVRHVW